MGVLKKALMGLGIAIAAIIALPSTIGLAGLYWVTTPPKFEVRSVAIADHDGYPATKIAFETYRYAAKSYLMTPEGVPALHDGSVIAIEVSGGLAWGAGRSVELVRKVEEVCHEG